MDLIPVIDLMNGQVVRGIAGDRDSYRPNVSCLVNSADPLETCAALRQSFTPGMIYLADLDGILKGQIQESILESLIQTGQPLAIDAGVDTVAKASRLAEIGDCKIIIGLETLPSLHLISKFVEAVGANRLIFSVDLRDGNLMGPAVAGMHPLEVVTEVLSYGIHQMIVLELTSIGMNRGVTTAPLCHAIKNKCPEDILWTGGGVRSLADLHRLSLARLDGVLVSAALHDGRITPSQWQAFLTMSEDDTLLAMDA